MRSFKEYAQLVNENLPSALPKAGAFDRELLEACRYSLLAPGKRLRGTLALAAGEYAGAPLERALPFALAVECVHAYSLIHDDLPAMDNDTLRRGRPTCHVAFGEAMAILAGDALLSQGLLLMAEAAARDGAPAVRAMEALTKALGIQGMVGGQAQDMLSERSDKADEAALDYIQANKTAALIRAPLLAGLLASGAPARTLQAFSEYGLQLGIAFQVADDILDVSSTPEALGKSIGKDAEENKLTAVKLFGLQGARQRLLQATRRAVQALEGLPETAFFTDLAEELCGRSF